MTCHPPMIGDHADCNPATETSWIRVGDRLEFTLKDGSIVVGTFTATAIETSEACTIADIADCRPLPREVATA